MREEQFRGVHRPTRPGPSVAVGLAIVLLVAALGVPPVQPAEAQDSVAPSDVPEAAAEAISQLWSPYCPGLMLEVCTSAGGAALRDSIQDQARAGMSADSIVEFWVARYGEEYRAVPTFTGAGRVAWIAPFAALLVGLVAAWVVLSRRSRGRHDKASVAELTPEEETRLSEALEALDRTERPDF